MADSESHIADSESHIKDFWNSNTVKADKQRGATRRNAKRSGQTQRVFDAYAAMHFIAKTLRGWGGSANMDIIKRYFVETNPVSEWESD